MDKISKVKTLLTIAIYKIGCPWMKILGLDSPEWF